MEQQINLNKNVTIELTPQHVGIILTVLKKQTYEQVCDVIATMEQQIIEQVRKKPDAASIVSDISNGVAQQ